MTGSTARRPIFVGLFLVAMLVLGITSACAPSGGSSSSGACTNGCPRVSGSCGTYCGCSVFGCSFGACCYVTACSCNPLSCGCF